MDLLNQTRNKPEVLIAISYVGVRGTLFFVREGNNIKDEATSSGLVKSNKEQVGNTNSYKLYWGWETLFLGREGNYNMKSEVLIAWPISH